MCKPKRRADKANDGQNKSKESIHDDRSNRGDNGLLTLNIGNDMERSGSPEGSEKGKQQTTKAKKTANNDAWKKNFTVDCTTVYMPNGKSEQKTPLNKQALQKYAVE